MGQSSNDSFPTAEAKADEHAREGLLPLTLGGTAVGTGLNAPKGFSGDIGYQDAAHIAESALANDQTLKEAALASGHVDEKTFDSVVDPRAMVGHGVSGA
jgi:fumarate hydratase class II